MICLPLTRFKIENNNQRLYQGLLFCLISTIVPWTGNELAGDDVENCENSQLTLKNLSLSSNFGSVSVEILLK